jgi:cell division protein FtsB
MGAVPGAAMTNRVAPEVEDAAPVRKRRWGWVLAALLLGALALTVSGILPFRQLVAQQRQIDRAGSQLEALSSENERLEGEIIALQTDAEVERIARDQYGLVRPGEVGYVVVVPPGASEDDEVLTAVPSTDERSLWERLWDFVTGGDLDGGG